MATKRRLRRLIGQPNDDETFFKLLLMARARLLNLTRQNVALLGDAAA